jgi:hypothetical protein
MSVILYSNRAAKPSRPPPPSPLVICDRLLSLAEDADRAGLVVTADHLVHLASAMFEEAPHPAS